MALKSDEGSVGHWGAVCVFVCVLTVTVICNLVYSAQLTLQ